MTIKLINEAEEAERKEWADMLRDLANRVEKGEVTDFIFVANDKVEGIYMCNAYFADRWRMLGAIEYAKLKFFQD